MMIAFRTADSFAAHAVCAAAGFRDGLRAAQFYVRDLSSADGGADSDRRNVTFLSRVVARLARFADRTMSWSANTAIALLLPGWRRLPSPFTPGMMAAVSDAIARNSLVHNPLFNAYFFRAAIHIIQYYSEPPFLVLEHRVDAARRALALEIPPGGESETRFLARVLLAMVDAGPIAKVGKPRDPYRLFESVDRNVAVCAIACMTLLFAGQGKPIETLGDDEFLAITGALILPRLKAIAALTDARDEAGLARELAELKSMY